MLTNGRARYGNLPFRLAPSLPVRITRTSCARLVPRVGWPGHLLSIGNAVWFSKGWARWDANLVMQTGSTTLSGRLAAGGNYKPPWVHPLLGVRASKRFAPHETLSCALHVCY